MKEKINFGAIIRNAEPRGPYEMSDDGNPNHKYSIEILKTNFTF